MSMKINGNDENSYMGNVQPKQPEKAEKRAEENKAEGIPLPSDKYIKGEKSGERASGLYHMEQDGNGNPQIVFDAPAKRKEKSGVQAEENSARKTTVNTDKVDREVEKLKAEKSQLEQQLRATKDDEQKSKELEEKLAQIERELSEKDNDSYRRQNAMVLLK